MVTRYRLIILMMLAASLALGLGPAGVLAQQGITATTGYTLRLRAGPGEEYPGLGVVHYHTTVNVEARSADNQWILVRSQTQRGWIAAWLASINGSLDVLPASSEVLAVSSLPVTAQANVRVRSGPGTDYSVIAAIPAGTTLTAIGRDAQKLWLLVDNENLQGWAASWLFSSSSSVSTLPIYTEPSSPPAPASPTSMPPMPALQAGYTAHMSYIDGAAADIYKVGQTLGNNPHAFTKVGASDTAKVEYLRRIDDKEYDLAAYGYLQEVVTYFSGSFNYAGPAMHDGMPIEAMFNAIWSDPDICRPGETPIECDYRIHRPSIVFMQLLTAVTPAGPNSQYDQKVRSIVDFYIARGVIPVLMTNSRSYAPQASWQEMNETLRLIAHQYHVPLWDFNATTETLPNYGLGPDGSHVSIPEDTRTTYFYPEYMQYGMVRRNLESLEVLHALLHTAMDKE